MICIEDIIRTYALGRRNKWQSIYYSYFAPPFCTNVSPSENNLFVRVWADWENNLIIICQCLTAWIYIANDKRWLQIHNCKINNIFGLFENCATSGNWTSRNVCNLIVVFIPLYFDTFSYYSSNTQFSYFSNND